jgi:UPF0755 protein
MKKLIIAITMILSILLTGCGEIDYTAVDLSDSNVHIVEVPRGATTKKIAELLKTEGLIKNSNHFKAAVKEKSYDGKLQAGTYSFTKAMDLNQIIDSLKAGKIYVETEKVVIPEGYELYRIREELLSLSWVNENKLDKALYETTYDYKFLGDGPSEQYLEGFLFPATYNFKVGTSEENIVKIMLNKFDSVFKDEYYDRIDKLDIDINQLMTMASIVEREIMVDDERKIAAGVFYNRIDDNMKLQSCATVQYLLKERKANLSNADLKIESKYNTYKYLGLPPGPIASPGEKSILAALYPEDSDYLFFVKSDKNDGSHVFSKTLKEHNIAKQKWKKSLKN